MASVGRTLINAFFPEAGSLLTSLDAARQVSQGADLQVMGANMEAQAYRNRGYSAISTANYNQQLEQFALERNLESVGRNLRRVVESQRSSMAASGISSSSDSFLSVMHDTLSEFERQAIDMRTNTRQRQIALIHAGNTASVDFENQARIAEFRGQISAYEARERQAENARRLSYQAPTVINSTSDRLSTVGNAIGAIFKDGLGAFFNGPSTFTNSKGHPQLTNRAAISQFGSPLGQGR
jgi:hypothetical protein